MLHAPAGCCGINRWQNLAAALSLDHGKAPQHIQAPQHASFGCVYEAWLLAPA